VDTTPSASDASLTSPRALRRACSARARSCECMPLRQGAKPPQHRAKYE
jgi:hypothetical protein